jgi:hypothetical protein
MNIGKYSFGIGDRFGRQGVPLLAAVKEAERMGVEVTPVWNKSQREHTIIGTTPAMVRAEAEEAVASMGWGGHYYVDADHITLKNVDAFIESSDFFTLDVSDYIGRPAEQEEIEAFVAGCQRYAEGISIQGVGDEFVFGEDLIRAVAGKYLAAVKQAGRLYGRIVSKKGVGNFITELSIDEAETAQTPLELFFILAAVSQKEMLIQTIAPKFGGRFNKGVDYAGDIEKFEREFEKDLAVIAFAVEDFGLPKNFKLSVHSGSDKFSIYGPMNKAIKKFGAGLHVKTAGTTWLEELAGLALAGGKYLEIANRIYAGAYSRMDELTKPYAMVIDIDRRKLPEPEVVAEWSSTKFDDALRHNTTCGRYNPHLRQLLHVAYKIAAEMGTEFTEAAADCQRIIGPNVTENIFERHIKPIFVE